MAWETSSTEDNPFKFTMPGKDSTDLLGGAISDLFGSDAAKDRAKGFRAEAEGYRRAAGLADQNAQFDRESTAIQTMQAGRQIYQGLGSIEAAVGSSGIEASGGALDILRSSAQQGALQQAILQRQGLITEAGHKEQASSYRDMAGAADRAERAAKKAGQTAGITGAIKGAVAIGKMFI